MENGNLILAAGDPHSNVAQDFEVNGLALNLWWVIMGNNLTQTLRNKSWVRCSWFIATQLDSNSGGWQALSFSFQLRMMLFVLSALFRALQ